ncbi:MAG: hypothetical protein ACLP7Q_06520 [Isosphaeraceae bacterium]
MPPDKQGACAAVWICQESVIFFVTLTLMITLVPSWRSYVSFALDEIAHSGHDFHLSVNG